ncbi:hypothetical protein Q0F98_38515 [Paenibacillus amylolyticus]|nr:hypothetical protein Q0F98_38515 [Paenibacillus amylolyticus]
MPTETLDFRDPKVFWHEESSNWVMVLCGKRPCRILHIFES